MINGNRKWIWLSVTLLGTLVGGVFLGQSTRAGSTPVPGSAADPVVTQSYVDQKIQALTTSLGTTSGQTSTPSQLGFQVVQVPNGKTVVASTALGLEVVIRTGIISVIQGSQGGIADLTTGGNLTDGNAALNHYLILARNDGRGLRVNSTDSYMLIRGAYTLQ